jgi:hypothetical protein
MLLDSPLSELIAVGFHLSTILDRVPHKYVCLASALVLLPCNDKQAELLPGVSSSLHH